MSYVTGDPGDGPGTRGDHYPPHDNSAARLLAQWPKRYDVPGCLTATKNRKARRLGLPRSPRPSEAESRCSGILTKVNPRDRLRSVGRRVTDPAEELAQQVTERVVDLVVSALDINEILAHVDLNALLSRIDINALLARADINAILA